jgi:hypothetical protein
VQVDPNTVPSKAKKWFRWVGAKPLRQDLSVARSLSGAKASPFYLRRLSVMQRVREVFNVVLMFVLLGFIANSLYHLITFFLQSNP